MSNVTHYTRVRKYIDSLEAQPTDERAEIARLDASLAVSTALREVTQAVASGFRDVKSCLLDGIAPDALVEVTGADGNVAFVVSRDQVITVRPHADGAIILLTNGQGLIVTGRTVADVATEVTA